jgi:branched-subunit amino acid aminotransferase/4-amino-4-deoxychorismate lyase
VNVRGCSLIILAKHKPPVYERRSIRLATVRQRRLIADEVFCTGRMGEIIAVTQVDETRFNLGRSGQVTIRISQLYQELTQAEGYAILG